MLGKTYHKLYGSAGTAQDNDGTVEPGEAYQGTWTGFTNTPGALKRYCHRHPDFDNCAN